jgi:hypothetical protein
MAAERSEVVLPWIREPIEQELGRPGVVGQILVVSICAGQACRVSREGGFGVYSAPLNAKMEIPVKVRI